MKSVVRLVVTSVLLALFGAAQARAEDACVVCDPAKSGDLASCLKQLVGEPAKCFDVAMVCDASKLPQLAAESPLKLTCSSADTLRVEADAKKLAAVLDKQVSLSLAPTLELSGKATFNGATVAAGECSACAAGTDCFGPLLTDPRQCFYVPGACAAPVTTKLKVDDKDSASTAVNVTCEGNSKLAVRADSVELKKLKGKTLKLTVASGPISLSAKASYSAPKEEAKKKTDVKPSPPSGGAADGSKPSPLPIDIVPLTANGPARTGLQGKAPHTRYIYVQENLAVDPASAEAATETDRVVVRFIARKALLCRYYATSDDKNEYKPEPGRVGGREGLASLLKSVAVGAPKEGDSKPSSCGYPLIPDPNGNAGDDDGQPVRFLPDPSGKGSELGYVDFTFGPFTSDQLTFHLFRHDRDFKGNDMQGDIKVANHLRYVGWADVMVVATFLHNDNQVISVNRQNGTELTRIGTSNQRQQLDIVAQIKFFLACTGTGNGGFQAQDLNNAGACIGLGSGFSLTHPTQRFYPLNLNVTLGRYLSLNLVSILERSKRLAPGYANGDLFSGSANDVPTTERLNWGGGIGVGMDPTLLGDLVGKIIKAGL